jgi:glycosyltransferase involved in cell wall biosynthesis
MTCSSHAHVNSDKVRLVPLVTEIAPEQHRVLRDEMRTGDYFLWPTNISFHKNHLRAIEALENYYSDFNGRLRCVITGVNTTWIDANADEPETKWDYVFKVRNAFKKSGLLGDRVEILGDVPRKRYWNLLRQAHFVFHPTLIDNGTLVTVEAASVGVPVLSHDYPPMRFYECRFHIPIKFTDANDVTRMASALSEMEADAHDVRERMPTWNSLREFDWRNQAQAFWRAVRAGIA